MTYSSPLVVIIDDDLSVRESLQGLVEQLGFSARAFLSAESFLASGCASRAKCLVLDVGLPGMSGAELQDELLSRGCHCPTIFITGRVDEALRARMLAKGAVGYLVKPFGDTEFARTLKVAFANDDGA